MKRNIFVTLLLVVLAIILVGNRVSTVETAAETNVAYAQNIENTEEKIETEPDETETIETEPVETEPLIFDESITFNVTYVNDGEVMPYALFEPSSAEDNPPEHLIVWLHGLGEVSVSEETFLTRGPAGIIPSWKLENFNAYIICPHLKGKYNSKRWSIATAETNLANLLDKFIEEHNIEKENISLMGASLGGQGVAYMAVKMPDYFSRAVVLSGYASIANMAEIKIPVIGYVGTIGEDSVSIKFMKNTLAPAIGEEKVKSVEASHADVPKVVFNFDDNGNCRSDVFEWLLGETISE